MMKKLKEARVARGMVLSSCKIFVVLPIYYDVVVAVVVVDEYLQR
jgi:hypothetical protein